MRYHKPAAPQENANGMLGVGGLAGELLPSSFSGISGAQSQGGAQPQLAYSASSPGIVFITVNTQYLFLCIFFLNFPHFLRFNLHLDFNALFSPLFQTKYNFHPESGFNFFFGYFNETFHNVLCSLYSVFKLSLHIITF